MELKIIIVGCILYFCCGCIVGICLMEVWVVGFVMYLGIG